MWIRVNNNLISLDDTVFIEQAEETLTLILTTGNPVKVKCHDASYAAAAFEGISRLLQSPPQAAQAFRVQTAPLPETEEQGEEPVPMKAPVRRAAGRRK